MVVLGSLVSLPASHGALHLTMYLPAPREMREREKERGIEGGKETYKGRERERGRKKNIERERGGGGEGGEREGERDQIVVHSTPPAVQSTNPNIYIYIPKIYITLKYKQLRT